MLKFKIIRVLIKTAADPEVYSEALTAGRSLAHVGKRVAVHWATA